jgi:hypothetical protein
MKRSKKEKEILRRNIYRYSMFMACFLAGKEMNPQFYFSHDFSIKGVIMQYTAYRFNTSLPFSTIRVIPSFLKKKVISCIIDEYPEKDDNFVTDCIKLNSYYYITMKGDIFKESKQDVYDNYADFVKKCYINYQKSLERIDE